MTKYKILYLPEGELIMKLRINFTGDEEMSKFYRLLYKTGIYFYSYKDALVTLNSAPKLFQGPIKPAIFLSRTKANKWINVIVKTDNIDPLFFELVKHNAKEI